MLKKARRLARAEFECLIAHGRRFRGTAVTLIALPSPKQYFRFGVSVGKKVAKTSVVRHALRRSVYDMLTDHLTVSHVPCDVAALVAPGAAQVSRHALRADIEELAHRLEVSIEPHNHHRNSVRSY